MCYAKATVAAEPPGLVTGEAFASRGALPAGVCKTHAWKERKMRDPRAYPGFGRSAAGVAEFGMRRAGQLIRRRVDEGPAVRLCGLSVANRDARTLVDLLLHKRTHDAIAAATLIEEGIRRQVAMVPLTLAERDAVLSVLWDPPDGLVGLHDRLADDRTRSRLDSPEPSS